ncbi:ribosomal RNA small subunit methyltransferase H-like [Zingiber officinale]|uniref:ribosomal RNA small subunit methyltransferase H-like n=1 Tax=Zingiber officinale TaxID=94328 RepID=UPI001C4C5638|nr:ribosomal RNA small subunit methyltransferase H-like [Zingiber officinale]
MDMDASIHDQARARIEKLLAVDSRGSKLKAYTHVRNFKYIKSVLGGVDENLLDVGVNDILMDLGISSMQVDDSTRGFSVQGDGPLDMRMNPQASLTAEEILNSWPAAEVGKVLCEYGEESNWKFIQNQIVEARAQGGLHTTDELVHLVRRASSNLGENVLEVLKEMIPSRDEEIKLKQSKEKPPLKLGPAESFLKSVISIPYAFKRVVALLYISNFDLEVNYLNDLFRTLKIISNVQIKKTEQTSKNYQQKVRELEN